MTVSEDYIEDGITKDIISHLQQLLLSDTLNTNEAFAKGSADDYLDQLAPIIKDALASHHAEELTSGLDNITRTKDQEIEALCNGDQNEYMASVQQLDQVTAEAEGLKSMILDLNMQMQISGKGLIEKRKRLLEAKTVRTNVDSAIEAVTACLQVLDITNKVYELIRDRRRFAALKSLDELQNIHLKGVKNFGFAQMINKSVPALTKIVRTESLVDLDAWIASLGKFSSRIGQVAFEHIESLREDWRTIQTDQPQLQKYKFNSPVELSFRDTDFDYLENKHIQEDLSSLYESALVHASLGLTVDFREHFKNELKVQRDYLIPSKLSIKPEDPNPLFEVEVMFQSVAGFCIIDKIISRRLKGLRLSDDVDEFWSSLCQKLVVILNNTIQALSDLDILRSLRTMFILFILTMQNFDFDISPLQRLLIALLKQYNDKLQKKFTKDFMQTVEEDDYMPMVIKNKDLYSKIASISWYNVDEEDLDKPFPRVLPFSQVYPLCCAEVRKFVQALESFMDDLEHDEGEVEFFIKTSVDDILVKTVSQAFFDRLKSTAREQIVQILVNMKYFENMASEVEKLLQESSTRKTIVSLNATETFQACRKKAEVRIFELVNNVVDQFLDIADYDWRTTTKNTTPSTYLTEMVTFLKTMINSTLVNLPHSIRSFLYLDAFDHLCSSLLEFLISSDSLTVQAVENFDMDVKYLEAFINELAQDQNDMSLTTTVLELRQSIDLLRSQDMTDYNNALIRMKKYDRVKPENAQSLFQKVYHARSTSQSSAELSTGGSSSNKNGTGSKIMGFYRRKLNKSDGGNNSSNES